MSETCPLYIGIAFFVFGAVIGSFLNVCIYRLPRDKSVVRPGSICTACSAPIRWYDNIPFVSYLILRGRCRSCGQSFSPRYLLVELITALLFLACYRLFGLTFELPAMLVFVSLLIVISFIDLDFQIIPDVLSIGGLVLGFALSFFRPDFGWTDSLLGILVGGGILYVISMLYQIIRKAEGMGGGDIKLLGMIGAFCGIKGVIFSLIAGSLVGTLVGVPLMLTKREGMKYAIPFGPFLSLGSLVYAFAGNKIMYEFFRFLSP